MDWVQYWFMFPVSMCIATIAMLSGIGGAAYFIPIFAIIFPILGPEYSQPMVAAIAVALFTETFGFASGFIAYRRRGLIDYGMAKHFLIFAVPFGILGALLAFVINEELLKIGYGLLMLILAYVLLKGHAVERKKISDDGAVYYDTSYPIHKRSLTDRDGNIYNYHFHRPRKGSALLGFGGFLTGVLGVGIGEVTLPLLARRYRVHIPVAAATSILVVIITVMSASFTQFSKLIQEGGVNAVPWNLICYTVPAVILGGQIGPRVQGLVPARLVEILIGSLFMLIGIAFIWIVYRGFN
jgi:uncharacterized membrane protein YfcA